MSSLIHINSDEIIKATEQIRTAIEKTQELADEIGNSLDANAGAYGEGDIDEKEIRANVDDIKQTIADNAQVLADSISKLREFANAMNQVG